MDGRERRHDIDWLRVFAMFFIFLFHCAIFFSDEKWHVKNNLLSPGLSIFVYIMAQWLMPLFFMISAIASYYSLNSRSGRSYISERFKRLVVPLVFGSFFVIAPLQVWIERVTQQKYAGTFLEFFFSDYFKGMYGFGGNFAWMGLHLWYLEALFIASLITLPLFRFFNSKKGRDFISHIAYVLEKRWYIYLSAIPLVAVELLANLQPRGIGRRDFGGWNLFSYLVFFVTGYIFASDKRFADTIERRKLTSLIIYITALSVLGLIEYKIIASSYVLYFTLRAVVSICALLAIFGYGSRYLSFSNKALEYCNEAVLPFYILHQTIIVSFGFILFDRSMGIAQKYVLISVSSFIVIVAIYDLLIKRISLLRFLFGMKARKSQP